MRWSWPFTRKTYWQDMSDLMWLDYVTRNIRRVRSYDEERDGLLICDVALHSHFTTEITAYDFADLIKKGRQYEDKRLVPPGRKRKWRLRWRT